MLCHYHTLKGEGVKLKKSKVRSIKRHAISNKQNRSGNDAWTGSLPNKVHLKLGGNYKQYLSGTYYEDNHFRKWDILMNSPVYFDSQQQVSLQTDTKYGVGASLFQNRNWLL